MRVLVTDGENRSALAVTRSLGKAGYHVTVVGTCRRTIASMSKYCAQSVATADPLSQRKQYVRDIVDVVEKHHIEMIVPMTEQSIDALNSQRELLSQAGVTLCCETAQQMEAVSNKFQLFKRAQHLGVPVPQTLFIEGRDDFRRQYPSVENFPVVVKPSLSRIKTGTGYVPTKVMYANSMQELTELYTTREELQSPSMIQEKIIGPGTGLFTLFANGQHVSLFSHRRLREKPPSGGVSVVCESVALDDEMVRSAQNLLSDVDWSGIAMVEFKRDRRDGKAKLMEINGRFWGSLQLAISSGVDFPKLYLDFLTGGLPEMKPEPYQIGHRQTWFLGTLDHLLIRLKYSRNRLNLPPDAPSRWQCLKEFFQWIGHDRSFDVFRLRDPKPFGLECWLYLKNLMGR